MGCRIMEDRESFQAVLYCSTTMWAFGPIFRTYEHAEDFLKWLGYDPRSLSYPALEKKHSEWCTVRLDDEGDLVEDEDGQG